MPIRRKPAMPSRRGRHRQGPDATSQSAAGAFSVASAFAAHLRDKAAHQALQAAAAGLFRARTPAAERRREAFAKGRQEGAKVQQLAAQQRRAWWRAMAEWHFHQSPSQKVEVVARDIEAEINSRRRDDDACPDFLLRGGRDGCSYSAQSIMAGIRGVKTRNR